MNVSTGSLYQQDPADSSHWQSFILAKTANDLSRSWLALLCYKIPGAKAAAVLVENQDQSYVPMAVWPEANPSLSRLAGVVETVLRERRGVVLNAPPVEQNTSSSLTNLKQLAYPVFAQERIIAVVAVEADCSVHIANQALRDIHWASAWLSNLLNSHEQEATLAAKVLLSSVLEVLAVVLRHGKLQQALFEMVNELRQRLDCERVAIGLVNHANVKLMALSEAATFEKNTSLAKAYLRAMEETYDYGRVVQYDSDTDASDFPGHRLLLQTSGSQFAFSFPLMEGGHCIGILTLERSGKAFSKSDNAWLDAFGALVASIISQRRIVERNALARLIDDFKSVFAKLFGPRHLVWKLITSASLILVAVLTLVQIDYRVTAKTVIEGETQRVIPAPFDGFIHATYVRAGDTVKPGQLMATLDDRDLIIEKARWSSERDQYDNRLRDAMATHDLTAVQVIGAQLAQAEAELSLVEQKVQHAHLVAPFAGLVVSGDLSQQIGAPVEVGKKLFEVAPLQSYRVILQVDEREIRHITTGQKGRLVITGIAGDAIDLSIEKITPVATTEDGKNFFRVEAHLSDAPSRLSPGMEGIGKVSTGKQPLWWVLLHSFTDWLRLTLWTWLP